MLIVQQIVAETETGTPAAATTTPSPAVSTPEMFNRSPTPTSTNAAVPSPADFGPPGMNGTPSFAPFTRGEQHVPGVLRV